VSTEAGEMGTRAASAVLGLWLFLSTFLWRHTPFQLENGWVVGIAVVAFAMLGLPRLRWTRFVVAALGGWLIVTAILTPESGGPTIWSNLFTGVALAFVGLLPPAARARSSS
jgi:hypothetical protein